jgi:hypothetical protein
MTMLVPILAGIGALCMSNPRRRHAKKRRAKSRRRNPASVRDLTDNQFNIGPAQVTVLTWRNKNATAFVAVTARSPTGVRTWKGHSQGPSSGGFSKPQQALEHVFNQMTRDWPKTQGSTLIKQIAHIAAEYVGAPQYDWKTQTNPRRRGRGRRNPPYHAHVGPVYMRNGRRNPTPKGYKSAAGNRLGLEIKYGEFPERALQNAWIVARQGGDHTALEAITRAQEEMKTRPGIISGERIIRKLARELGYTGRFDGPKYVNPRRRKSRR